MRRYADRLAIVFLPLVAVLMDFGVKWK